MFNEVLGNTTQFNQYAQADAQDPVVIDDIVFNNFGLQNDNVVIETADVDSAANRTFQTAGSPSSDGELLLEDDARRTIIPLNGYLIVDTADEMQTLIDDFKRALYVAEEDLTYINRDGVRRKFPRTTLVNRDQIFKGQKDNHVTYLPFSLEFASIAPHSEDTSFTSDFQADQTIDEFDVVLNLTGAAPTFFAALINIVAGSSFSQIDIENRTNSQKMIITQPLVAGDTIDIDGSKKKGDNGELTGNSVTLNGVEISYSGNIPKLETGINLIRYTMTSTSHTISVTTKTKNRY